MIDSIPLSDKWKLFLLVIFNSALIYYAYVTGNVSKKNRQDELKLKMEVINSFIKDNNYFTDLKVSKARLYISGQNKESERAINFICNSTWDIKGKL